MYRAVTRHIEVVVEPSFLPERSSAEDGRFFWAYTIAIINSGTETVQLKTRHWIITDGAGHSQEVRGEGVVGEQPILPPGGTHDYVSGCPLTTPHGSMEGHYTFRREDGAPLRVAIPFFPLAAPATAD